MSTEYTSHYSSSSIPSVECKDLSIVDFDEKYMEDLLDLERECFDQYMRYSEEVFKYYFAKNSIFKIARCCDLLIGYVLADVEGDICHVVSIAVKPSYRRRGIGSVLMNSAMGECRSRGASVAVLEVETGNTPAINMYTKLGFHVTGFIKSYYSRDRDAFLMIKKLDE